MKFPRLLISSTLVTALLTACGGGGDSSSVPTMNLSPLVGIDTSVTATFVNSCTGTGTNVTTWQSTATGDTLIALVKDNYGADALNFTLKYVSGDNAAGYNFSGAVKDNATGAIANVQSTSLRNTSTDGSLNISGTMNATDVKGCSDQIRIS